MKIASRRRDQLMSVIYELPFSHLERKIEYCILLYARPGWN
jgi:hypothetical protein